MDGDFHLHTLGSIVLAVLYYIRLVCGALFVGISVPVFSIRVILKIMNLIRKFCLPLVLQIQSA